MAQKICSRCKDPKPIDEFYLKKGKPVSACSQCCRIDANKYYDGSNKISCPRGEGQMITKSQCLPGCNDACKTCEHFTKDVTINTLEETGIEAGIETGVRSSAGYTVDAADSFYC